MRIAPGSADAAQLVKQDNLRKREGGRTFWRFWREGKCDGNSLRLDSGRGWFHVDGTYSPTRRSGTAQMTELGPIANCALFAYHVRRSPGDQTWGVRLSAILENGVDTNRLYTYILHARHKA